MLSRAYRAFRAQPGDAGITLTELIVSMALMTIVGAMALTYFVGSNRATSRTTDASLTTAQARVAMSSAVRLLQLADSPTAEAGSPDGRFETISTSSVVFYSNADDNRSGLDSRTAPDKVALTITSGRLVEKLYQPPRDTSAPADYTNIQPTTRVLLDGLGGGSGFTFCSDKVDAAGNCITTASPTAVASVLVTFVLPGLRGETSQTLTSSAAVTGALQ